jgi:hypothetical protein
MVIMDAPAAAAPGLTASFEKLLLSSVRLSSAATLFGVYQFESAVNGFQDPGSIGKQLDRFGETVESLAQCLVEEISPGKQDALASLTDMTGKVVKQSMEGLSYFDPRQVIRIANNLAQRSSEAAAGWGKPAPPPTEPQLAADVLGS